MRRLQGTDRVRRVVPIITDESDLARRAVNLLNHSAACGPERARVWREEIWGM